MTTTSKLGCEIVREHFGEAIAQTFSILVHHGHLTLADLLVETKLPYKDLRTHLLVLLQQNLVVASTEGGGDQSKQATQYRYEANLDMVLLRLRFSRFSTHIQEKFGEGAQLLFEELLEHGRLTADQCVQQAMATSSKSGSGTVYGEDKKNELICFLVDMIKHRYVIRIKQENQPKPVVAGATASSTTASTDKSKPKRKRKSDTAPLPKQARVDNNIPIELRLLQGSLGLEGEKGDAEEGEGLVGVLDVESVLKFDEEANKRRILDDRDTLWGVNVDKFNQDFRNKAIVDFVTEKVNLVAGKLVETILQLTAAYQKTKNDETTIPVPVDRILAAVNQVPKATEQMTRDSLCNYLDLLCHQTPQIVNRLSDINGGSYVVCLGTVASFIKQKSLEAIVLEKFGVMSCRIFRLLLQHHQLEQKQIADFAMLPIKECRERLFQMLKANILSLQEIPKSADRAPSRTIYLWKVQLGAVNDQIVQEMFKTMWNIKKRRQHEFHSAEDLVHTFTTKPDTLTEAQKRQLKQLQEIVNRLDKAMLQLDQTMIVLRDF